MKRNLMGMMVLALSLIAGWSGAAMAREAPVAKLVQVEGDVQYTRNGTDWRPVQRTKYLFAGYQIKTGTDGSGKIINQTTGKSRDMGKNTVVAVDDEGVSVVSGNLSEAQSESVSIFESLNNKFATAQRYTTVRRSVTTQAEECDNKVRTVREVTLSPSHPDLVWRNACPEYSYRLVIGDEVIEIPAQSTSEMIRYTVEGYKPGEYSYHVEVLDNDGTVYIPRGESTFVWIDESDEAEIMAKLDQFGDDVFLKANLLEENEMFIAAMDAYRDYFNENPDDNDMRPLLIQSYQDLKLSNLRESEARLYNASLEEDY